MARKLRTKPRKAAYSRRVEPGFGQIMTCHNGRQFLLRGEDGGRGRLPPPPQDFSTRRNRGPRRGDRLTNRATLASAGRSPGPTDLPVGPTATDRATVNGSRRSGPPVGGRLLRHAPSSRKTGMLAQCAFGVGEQARERGLDQVVDGGQPYVTEAELAGTGTRALAGLMVSGDAVDRYAEGEMIDHGDTGGRSRGRGGR